MLLFMGSVVQAPRGCSTSSGRRKPSSPAIQGFDFSELFDAKIQFFFDTRKKITYYNSKSNISSCCSATYVCNIFSSDKTFSPFTPPLGPVRTSAAPILIRQGDKCRATEARPCRTHFVWLLGFSRTKPLMRSTEVGELAAFDFTTMVL